MSFDPIMMWLNMCWLPGMTKGEASLRAFARQVRWR
jgi:hypothetical protein